MGKSHTLRTADIDRLAAAVAAIHEPCPIPDFVERATAIFARLMEAPAAFGTSLLRRSTGAPAIAEGSTPIGLSPEAVDDYLRTHAARDPGLNWLARQTDPVVAFFPRLVLSPEEIRTHPVVETIYKIHGLRDGAAVCVATDPRRLILIACHFDHFCDEREREIIRLFAPRLARAARVKSAVDGTVTGLEPATALFVFDRLGREVFANPAARALMEEPGGRSGSVWDDLKTLALRLFERQRLGRLHEVENPLMFDETRRVGFTFDDPDGNGEPQSVALVVRRPPALPGPSGWMSGPPAPDVSGIRPVLAAVGATEREMEIAELLWRGKLEKEVARAIHRSVPTVKFHTGKLYRRCGVNRREEWMAWVSARKQKR